MKIIKSVKNPNSYLDTSLVKSYYSHTVKILLSFLTLFTALLIIPINVLAANPAPLQISPQNTFTVNSTKLEWLVPAYSLKSSLPYRVQVHSSPDFINPLKDTTTSNTFYSPQLTEGIWYWRILAKDQNSLESDWSPTWQFTYTPAAVIPSPTPIPSPSILPTPSPSPTITPTSTPLPSAQSIPSSTPTPTPLATPTPTPVPTPIPTPTPTPTPQPTSSFTISQLPSQVNSTESFSALVNLVLPTQPNTIFYLKGAFYDDGSSNYFGQTKFSGNWVKNSQTYSSQYKVQTDGQGKWQGNIEFIPDPQDTGFNSSGDYNFKVGRYTSSGSGPTWTDSQTIYINEIIPSPSPSSSISPVPSSSAYLSKLISPLPDPITSFEASKEGEISNKEATQSALNIDPQIASIEGVATVAGEMETNNSPPELPSLHPNWFYVGSGILFLTGLACYFIVKYKPQQKIKQWLSSRNQPKTPDSSLPPWPNSLNPEEASWPSSAI